MPQNSGKDSCRSFEIQLKNLLRIQFINEKAFPSAFHASSSEDAKYFEKFLGVCGKCSV